MWGQSTQLVSGIPEESSLPQKSYIYQATHPYLLCTGHEILTWSHNLVEQTILVSGMVIKYCDIPSSYASLAVGSYNIVNLVVNFRPTHSSWAGQLKNYFLHLSSLNWLLLRTPGFLYRSWVCWLSITWILMELWIISLEAMWLPILILFVLHVLKHSWPDWRWLSFPNIPMHGNFGHQKQSQS